MPEEKEPMVKEKIYWAPARKYALHLSKRDPELVGPYQREKRDNSGGMLQQAVPITFGEHIFVATSPAEQAVIENSAAFKNNEIVICVSMEAAYQRTAGKELEKTVSSGMVTMTDNAGRVTTPEEAQAENSKFQEVR